MIAHNMWVVRVVVLLLLVSLLLAGTSVVSAMSNSAPSRASCPCLPGVACCVTNVQCGWCHSYLCPGGYGILYNGNLKICYDASCKQTSLTTWCSWAPCGIGRCQ